MPNGELVIRQSRELCTSSRELIEATRAVLILTRRLCAHSREILDRCAPPDIDTPRTRLRSSNADHGD